MINRIGNYTLEFTDKPIIAGFGSIVGKKESEGPLKEYFDKIEYDTRFGQDSWEKAESMFQKEALYLALKRAEFELKDCNCIFAGDLLNQCISSGYAMRDYGVPYLGQYGACSTMAQGMAMAGVFVESGAAVTAAALTSSHFCSAERQYRYPLEYGGQRAQTAQWTVTGSGCVILTSSKKAIDNNNASVSRVTIGKIIDMGIKDAANMGAAMAPAAADTIKCFFDDTNTHPEEYDAIFTGDLGLVGTKLLYELLERENIDITKIHKDCGLLIFDDKTQDTHSGGSGCGCSASVLCSYILKNMQAGKLKKILFVATGALMSPTASLQGESIPSIAHLVEIVI
ncbi:MAG: stage V sporulation protein AD [Clostridiales bacterium]|nr:stage V sporulation protein AD [Clostridiales bacterium]